MSDEKDFDILPTRDNNPAGKSNENRMLAKTGRLGNDSFIKDQRNIVGPEGQKGIVRLKTRGGMPEFTTEFEEPEDEELEHCPLTDHGLVDCYYNASDNYDPAKYNAEAPVEKLVDWSGAVIKAKRVKSDPDTLNKLRLNMASMFSGLMRRVVQMENGKSNTSNRFGFSASFGLTHGLWCTPNGTRWLIEIDGSDVYVRSITFCKKLPKDWKSFEAALEAKYDKAKFAKKLAPYWTPTKLGGERTKIGTIPPLNGGPHYYGFGWAFDYEGSRACIVTTESRLYGWWDSSWNTLYELTFTADGAGKPTAVSCAKLDEDWFINRDTKEGVISGYGSLQVPYGPSGVCRTYEFWSPVSPERSLDAPVFAYYMKTGEMHVLRFYSPWEEPEIEDEGFVIQRVQQPTVRYGIRVDFGSFNQVAVHQARTWTEEPVYEGYFTEELGERKTKNQTYLRVGSFYSIFVPKAAGTSNSLETEEALVEEGEPSFFEDDLNDSGITISRTYWILHNSPGAQPNYEQFPYGHDMHPCMAQPLAHVSKNIDWSRRHYPFAVIHGHDRESYCAGYSEIETKRTVTIKGENYANWLTAIGNTSTYLGPWVSNSDYTSRVVGTTDVISLTYPRTQEVPPLEQGPFTTTEELEEKTKLVSKLVVGNQVFDLPSAGFGYYGPDALNFLYFRAAASAFGDNGVSKTMRSPDFQDLHLRTNCGGYVTQNVSNSFVGVI